jgi:hypothetical protein
MAEVKVKVPDWVGEKKWWILVGVIIAVGIYTASGGGALRGLFSKFSSPTTIEEAKAPVPVPITKEDLAAFADKIVEKLKPAPVAPPVPPAAPTVTGAAPAAAPMAPSDEIAALRKRVQELEAGEKAQPAKEAVSPPSGPAAPVAKAPATELLSSEENEALLNLLTQQTLEEVQKENIDK